MNDRRSGEIHSSTPHADSNRRSNDDEDTHSDKRPEKQYRDVTLQGYVYFTIKIALPAPPSEVDTGYIDVWVETRAAVTAAKATTAIGTAVDSKSDVTRAF